MDVGAYKRCSLWSSWWKRRPIRIQIYSKNLVPRIQNSRFLLTSDHITTPKLYVFPIFFPNNPYFPSLHVTRIFSVKRPQIYFDPTLWRGGQLVGRCTTSIAHILLHKIQNPYLGKYQGLKKHNSIFCMEFSITGGGPFSITFHKWENVGYI